MARRRLDAAVVAGAALELVDRGGIDALTLSAVAAALGVRPSALYSHVDNGAQLHHVVAVHAARDLADAVRRAAVGVSGPEALRAAAVAYRRFALAHPARYEAMLAPPTRSGEGLEAACADLHGVLVAVLVGAGMPSGRAVVMATSMRSSLHGYVALEAAGAHAVDAGHFDALVEMLVGALT